MSRFTNILIKVRRHRAFQVVVTAGIFGTFALSVYNPALAFESGVVNAITNLIWLWEPNHTA